MSFLDELKEQADREFAEKQQSGIIQSDNISDDNDVSNDTTKEVSQESHSVETSEVQETKQVEQNTEQNSVSAQETQQSETNVEQTVFANEELAKLNQFVKSTGKGVEDYLALQKSSEQFDKRELIKKYLSEKEGLSEREINRELKKYDDLDDEDFVDEDAKELFEIAHEKASKWWDANRESVLSSLKTEPTTELGETQSQEQVKRFTPEEYQNMYVEQIKEVQKYNNQQIASAIPELEYELKYSGSKEYGIEPLEISYKPDEDFLKEATKVGLDMGVLINDFFENGQVKDAKGLLKVLTQSYAPTSKVMIDKLIEQAVLKDRVLQSKKQRNVTSDYNQNVDASSDDSNKQAYEQYRKTVSSNPYQ